MSMMQRLAPLALACLLAAPLGAQERDTLAKVEQQPTIAQVVSVLDSLQPRVERLGTMDDLVATKVTMIDITPLITTENSALLDSALAANEEHIGNMRRALDANDVIGPLFEQGEVKADHVIAFDVDASGNVVLYHRKPKE
jgi:hypothetical protein